MLEVGGEAVGYGAGEAGVNDGGEGSKAEDSGQKDVEPETERESVRGRESADASADACAR